MAIVLLKQKIRNIASIVEADIDYVNGLVDYGTGNPSPLFIIFGDTGAGKTSILDALTLALYKTTPRIAGVEDKKNNSFKDKNGNDVNVFGISQYSRIGISHTDECYTEVEFKDRKGRRCIARLDLGYSKDGSYKNPVWRFESDGVAYEKKDVAAAIKESLGNDFAQYQQTSMLAQGRFDAFLTGGKDERKRIMEQLTNTEKFTNIGKAITSYFGRCKDDRKSAEDKVEAYAALLLNADELTDLQNQADSLVAEIEILNKAVEADEKKKNTTELLARAVDEREDAEIRKQQLELKAKSPEHLASVRLVADWDDSNDARQALADYDKAMAEIDASNKAMADEESRFDALNGDLMFRMNSLNDVKADKARVDAWLNGNADKEAVYAREGEISAKMGEYKRNADAIVQNKEKLSEEQSKAPMLQQGVDDARAALDAADSAVKRVQDVINGLNTQKENLKPEELARKLNIVNARRGALGDVKKEVEENNERRDGLVQKNATLAQLKVEIERIDEECEEANREFERVSVVYGNTDRIYKDVMMSRDKTLKTMRDQLAIDKADTCPLCGNRVNDWAVNLDGVLEPLIEQKKNIEIAKNDADRKRTDAINRRGVSKGKYDRLKSDIEEQTKKLNQVDAKIATAVAALGLDAATDLIPQIVAEIDSVVAHIGRLNADNLMILDLDGQIKTQNIELAKAQDEYRKADRAMTSAAHLLQNNAAETERLDKEIRGGRDLLNLLIQEINSLLNGHYGQWLNDVNSAVAMLKRDAEEYLSQKSLSDKLSKQEEIISGVIQTIATTKANVMQLCPSWTHASSAMQYHSANPASEWSDLYSRIYANIANINKNNLVKAESSKLLGDYYAKSGNNESVLRVIVSKSAQIAMLRQAIIDLTNGLAIQQQSIANAVKTIGNCCQILSISTPDEMEPLENIVQRLEENRILHTAKNVSLGEVKNKIKSDADNHTLHDKAVEDLNAKEAIFEKWYRLNAVFGGNKFCLLVQSYIMRPLLNNANFYLERITDRYKLTFSNENEQLSILVHDKYNQDQIRSATVLSGGERFMISLALSLALSALNRSESNFNVLFIDEGFGTLDEKSLNSVMDTLDKLPTITGQADRRVGIITHLEELLDRIHTQLLVHKQGDGRSEVEIVVK